MSDFNTIKNLYEDGYRCIYYDKLENNHTIYLKNFDNENSTVIELEAITKFMLRTPTKRVIENPVLASQMTNKESYISKTDFEQLLEGFFDWLVLQGIM